ncbi:uncharacterized protein BDR25DRAFT_245458 [Lindgomyces ingoldianus]|uniref:Uncharacterized protein n=1 Tax=Lindgomyces ingoldianus TaxID=673940 RepID=A0ACB6Q8Z3_9PLEO|nr:uncharacterized protein BDR25DRAFT_245458 [Lindgomyces ingoldianus]KAF2463514.1 hypothetical protein BDR25DRAFT_245458 [Lindgomyces ingoldianus]
MQYFKASFIFLTFIGWSDARACNNSPELCSKSYDRVTYLGAHDSPFIRDASTSYSSFGNQFFNTTTQLNAGVRLLSAQVHVAWNKKTGTRELHLCHTSCALFDVGPLKDWLFDIRVWMDKNPNEVVTLILVNGERIGARELESEYSRADIAHYGYVPEHVAKAPPPSNETNPTWPTLNSMIDSEQRLVSFIAPLTPDQANAPYLLSEWDFVWENPYEVTDPSNFTCDPDRPHKVTMSNAIESGTLFLMNHFLYWQQAFGIQVPDSRIVNTTNAWEGPGSLGAHMLRCSNMMMRQPTFVLVDFFNVGPAIKTVDIFNKVSKPVGRMNVTGRVVDVGMDVNSGGRSAGLFTVMVGIAVAIAGGWNILF